MHPKIRFYLDTGRSNPAVDLKPLQRTLHAEFAWWVANGHHTRDFFCAVDHAVALLMLAYMVGGESEWLQAAEAIPPAPLPTVNQLRLDMPPEARHRFYSASGELNPEVQDQRLRDALEPVFQQWVVSGYHPRDFAQAAGDVAVSIHYDFDTARSLAGLGGGRTAEEYLTQLRVL